MWMERVCVPCAWPCSGLGCEKIHVLPYFRFHVYIVIHFLTSIFSSVNKIILIKRKYNYYFLCNLNYNKMFNCTIETLFLENVFSRPTFFKRCVLTNFTSGIQIWKLPGGSACRPLRLILSRQEPPLNILQSVRHWSKVINELL